jgi:hypothetical protein
MPDENQPMREALERDAARVSGPHFNTALHHATMRRVRALAQADNGWHRIPLFLKVTAAAAILAVAVLVAREVFAPVTKEAPRIAVTSAASQPALPRATALAYGAAANEGDAALLAMLDRDARELLPATSSVFTALVR